MLSGFRNGELVPQYAAYIKDPEVRDALRMIIGLSAELEGWECYPMDLETKWDFRFFDSSGKQAFSFIPNQEWLLFYFRKPAVRSGQFDFQTLSGLLDSAIEKADGEWTVKIRDTAELRTLWGYLFPSCR